MPRRTFAITAAVVAVAALSVQSAATLPASASTVPQTRHAWIYTVDPVSALPPNLKGIETWLEANGILAPGRIPGLG